MKKIRIRRATAWDVVEITLMLVQGAKEQKEEIWYPSPSRNSTKNVGHVLALIDQGLVVIGEQTVDERIVGAIGMTICQSAWSDDWQLVNEWLYVMPEFRSTDLADQLLSVVEGFADKEINPETQEGLPVIMAMMSGVDTELKDELMRRRGYQYGGGNFVRRPYSVQRKENGSTQPDSDVVDGGEQASDGAGDGDS